MAFRQPGEGSPSFAQTGAELDLDDSDDDDLFNLDDYDEDGYQKAVDLHSEVGGVETYELRGMRLGGGTLSPSPRPGSSRSAISSPSSPQHQRRRRKTRRGSASTVASFKLYTPDEDAAVRRKFDRKLVLFVSLLYLLSFVDRSSTGFLLLFFKLASSSVSKLRSDQFEL